MPNFYNPYDEAFRANPWPIYHRMRDEAPAYFVEELNTWALSRFEDVLYGGMDRLHYTASVGTTMDALFYGAPTPPMFMWMDLLSASVAHWPCCATLSMQRTKQYPPIHMFGRFSSR